MKSLFDLSARQPPGRCVGGAELKLDFFIIFFLRTSSCKSRVLALGGWHHSHVLPSPRGRRPRQQTSLLRKLLTVLLSGAPGRGIDTHSPAASQRRWTLSSHILFEVSFPTSVDRFNLHECPAWRWKRRNRDSRVDLQRKSCALTRLWCVWWGIGADAETVFLQSCRF